MREISRRTVRMPWSSHFYYREIISLFYILASEILRAIFIYTVLPSWLYTLLLSTARVVADFAKAFHCLRHDFARIAIGHGSRSILSSPPLPFAGAY